jgi:hypothetical protein
VHVQGLVPVLGEQERPRGLAVAPRAAGLLVVRLERRRGADVDHRPHVGLVDAHSERVGRDHHVHFSGQEAAQHRRAPITLESGVVGLDLDP